MDKIAERLAEFMGYKTGGHSCGEVWVTNKGVNGYVFKDSFDPLNWEFWMSEVEPRIREKELWEEYIRELARLVESNDGMVTSAIMAATLPQRAEALMKVLEDRDA